MQQGCSSEMILIELALYDQVLFFKSFEKIYDIPIEFKRQNTSATHRKGIEVHKKIMIWNLEINFV